MKERSLPEHKIVATSDIFRGWDRTALTPESETPHKRQSAAVNVIQNGAQSLTVLAMNPDPRVWTSYGQINTTMRRMAEEEVVVLGTTRDHLRLCIEPTGAAVRSTIDDKNWAITQFGKELKPVILFAWQKLIELDIDPFTLFGKSSHVKKDNDGETLSSPAFARMQILLAGYKDSIQIRDLYSQINLSNTSMPKHVKRLEEAGFINVTTVDTSEGQSVNKYLVADDEKMLFDRQVYPSPRTNVIKEAILSLKVIGVEITIKAVEEKVQEKDPSYSDAVKYIERVMRLMVKRDLISLERPFDAKQLSSISLTELGRTVAEEVLLPIKIWSYSPEASEEINEIRRMITRNPALSNDIYSQIAKVFRSTSTHANADRIGRMSEIVALINNSQRSLTATEITISTGYGDSYINRLLRDLVAQKVITRVAVDGKKVRYVPYRSEESQ